MTNTPTGKCYEKCWNDQGYDAQFCKFDDCACHSPTENSWEGRLDHYWDYAPSWQTPERETIKDFIRREIQQAEQEAYRNGRADEADEHALECKRKEQEAYERGKQEGLQTAASHIRSLHWMACANGKSQKEIADLILNYMEEVGVEFEKNPTFQAALETHHEN